ncbi:dipeptidyl aminopeptidase/acylaminoacyl peptidase [Dysgonomonas sp. PFB1-18]|uniref:alpha/beta hydrolase family protein n=1 Tax=unclassified Dysgonomonas TaxID=2630389 RepID=UPI0024767E50|nr:MULTISPECIES: prolyl oligopeptidase family serine peptidase [unclassified Dysgonomonas]MDH6307345.1 dipeptidyl aminopeptidase/acylaminoacyl peptidase [Dysgonomonas sp. PF1-14]MDH6337263.1 dipeptidyl aminopeptidase/acylaminoacyl peptidase [Dysgonomonas sp. PF1-16]MDH6379187.1 dipeptidyl aminopeptidase/acylaminoacyl peptidase [Dysgonomonas sp. PFB1-18]MDH6396175.1 dipeptidyl aminopeptidase/acylaminoacyl peptidase [Dysgonomonas sp. PF1-23]
MAGKTHIKSVILGLAIFTALPGMAQKKVLDHSVYDSWKSISNISVTNDGKYSAAVVKEQEGDDYLLIRDLKTLRELVVPRGSTYSVAPDQKHIIVQIKAPFAVTRQAKIKKTADEKMPKDSLAIVVLDKFTITKIPNVKTYKTGKDFSDYIAYTYDDTLKVKDKKEVKAYSLILRNILTSKEDTIKNATEYVFSRNGKGFATILKPAAKDSVNKPGVLYIDLANYAKRTISTGKTTYKGLALSESGNKLTFLATADSLKKEVKDYSLYYFNSTLDSAMIVADKAKAGMPDKWNVSENYNPVFSKNEKRLLLGIAPMQLPKDTTIPDFEKAQLDIWHWKEPLIQPMQLVQKDKKLKQTYLSYIDLDNGNKFYQLATEDMPEVVISDENNGRYAVGTSNLNYILESQWDVWAASTNDVWLLNLDNHSQKQIKKGLKGRQNLSPQGNYLAWYNTEDRRYYAYSMNTGKEVCLTDELDVNFWNEKTDTPMLPYPYGIAGWMENDEALLVYDAYDIWKLDPQGVKAPENLTKGEGRETKRTLRYIKTDPESRFIKPDEKLLLSAFDNTTKENGFYELDAKSKLRQLAIDKYTYNYPVKAKEQDIYCYTKSNFNTSPNLYVTPDLWKKETKLSDINPQMKDYNWGTAELVSWTTFDGKTTQGIVYKPEDFDPNKKYPVMIYFYEQHTDNLYQYFPPAPSRSIINIPFYVSRGYIVFTPDIIYTTGHPGNDAYNCVVSGAEMMAKNAWVDKDNMAIQGQSWGGYQVAYLVTRTNMFKAAGSGAPVSNMFSAYGGIRWDTGMSRQFQYEQTQSRIGATMWEAPELYKENSPVFFADKVQTPLLIMHNDKDGAVPWYQGIEYFMALRRLGKPVWMLQYNNEAHNLKERKNTKDLSIRLQQFFDHYLKGAPEPVWMKTGVPAVDKGRTYGLELE